MKEAFSKGGPGGTVSNPAFFGVKMDYCIGITGEGGNGDESDSGIGDDAAEVLVLVK